ncbi:MAG: alpha/beta hydrolase [Spirosomaceae bacterium]|nr:alpha/beta hydrolase [Spirosomataceae bacterium]
MNESIKKPSWFLHFTEVFRAIVETFKGYFFIKKKGYKNIGRGIPVMVVPGLLSTDWATTILRKFLQKSGFAVQGWEMGMNLGRMKSLEDLRVKVEKLSETTGQKVILIGWSMGGIFSREVAKQLPEKVRCLITVGSPFANIQAPNHAKWIFNLLNNEADIDADFTAQLPVPAIVPTLCLYSKKDGIVPWQACKENFEDALHESREVRSSHFGMGANPAVLQEIGDYLKLFLKKEVV